MTYDVATPAAARLWDLEPAWEGGFSVTRSFSTDITTSRSNVEQRRSQRFEPRLSAKYRSIVNGADRRAASLWLRAWQNKPTIVPDYGRWARLAGGSSAGSSTLTISPVPAWVAADQPLVLCGDGTRESVLVNGISGTTISLADPLINAWPNGAILRPTFFGLFESTMQSSRLTPGAAEVTASIAAYPGGTPPREVGTPWALFNGREVFTPEPDYMGPPSLSYIWPVDRVDFGRGRTAEFRPNPRGETLFEADFNALSVTTAAEIEQFFDRMKGRRGSFFMPTGESDLVLAATATSGSSYFTVAGTALADDFGSVDYTAFEEAVAIFLTDGSRIYRRIMGITASSGNSQVAVDVPWSADLTSANVARISWMPICRFGSDEMTTTWSTPHTAGTRLTFQSVRDNPSYRYLRLTIDAVNGGSHFNAAEWEMASEPAGPNLIQGKSITASIGPTGSGLAVDRLNDGSMTGAWEPWSLPASATVDMGAGNGFVPVELRLRTNYVPATAKDFELYGSSDGTTFVLLARWKDITEWTSNVFSAFSVRLI